MGRMPKDKILFPVKFITGFKKSYPSDDYFYEDLPNKALSRSALSSLLPDNTIEDSVINNKLTERASEFSTTDEAVLRMNTACKRSKKAASAAKEGEIVQ